MKVAIYANIGNQKSQDTEDQLAQLCRHAHVLSQHREVYLFVDRQSGKASERAEFHKLFESAARREYQLVLVWALDRFVIDNVAATFENIQKLLRYGVQFFSFTEEYFRTTGPAGDRMILIARWITQQERIRISERTKAGLAKARAKGQGLRRPWKVFPSGRVAADRKLGMSWRQLARKYQLPQSTLRSAMQKLADAGGPQPEDPRDLSRVCAQDESL